MRAIDTITFNWEAAGALFATMKADEQAAFFRGVAGELSTWESSWHAEMQGCYVLKELEKLPEKQRECLERFLGMLTYRGGNDAE